MLTQMLDLQAGSMKPAAAYPQHTPIGDPLNLPLNSGHQGEFRGFYLLGLRESFVDGGPAGATGLVCRGYAHCLLTHIDWQVNNVQQAL